MRILHTSDWHLGRSFHRVGLASAQARMLDHLVEVVRAEKVAAVVVAGDVYDRALPSVEVVSLLDDALTALADAGAHVLLTSGNHDSARRLGFGSRLLERGRVHLRTDAADLARPVLLEDTHGPVALYGLPYLEPALTADVLGVAERSHSAVIHEAMRAVRADLATRPGARSVVASHAFVTGGTPCDSERDITVGGLAAVPASVFAGVDYVALGHLHGRQVLQDHLRYSGSPLAYSFSEARHTKGHWLVELGPSGVARVDAVDAPTERPLAVLRGRLADLLADPALAGHEGSWCQVTLTDAARPREPMEQLRRRFPHTLVLNFEPEGTASPHSSYTSRVRGLSDVELCCGFLEHVRGREADAAERLLMADAVEAARVAVAAGDDRRAVS